MKFPEFKPGEQLSAGKLNKLSAGAKAAQTKGGPGLHVDAGPEGVSVRETRYRRETLGRTGGTPYPASGDTITIATEFPFEFVDIDQDLVPIIKERGDAAFVCYSLSLTHIAEDTLVVLVEHRGAWYAETSGGGDGSAVMYFEIDAVICDEGSNERYLEVTPDRVAPPCTTPPGADSYGIYYVYDDGFGCILAEYTDDELTGGGTGSGMRGKATYTSNIGGTCAKNWTLDGLCDTGGC